MKRVLALLALGVLAPMIQGVAGTFFPSRFCPDLGMLVVVGIGLCWRSAIGGVLLATVLGFTADLLSGSLLGHHALLRLFAFGAARVGSRQLNLKGVVPQITFAAVLTVANAALNAALFAFFAATPGFEAPVVRDLVWQVIVNALFAPWVVAGVALVSNSLDDDARTLLTLQGRRT